MASAQEMTSWRSEELQSSSSPTLRQDHSINATSPWTPAGQGGLCAGDVLMEVGGHLLGGIVFNRFYRLEIHSLMFGIFDPACELLPPWTKELYMFTVAPLPSL